MKDEHDILIREDIKLQDDSFYDKVQAAPLIGPVFSHPDMPHHLPIMYNVWNSMLLGDQSCQRNPFQKHLPLAIEGQPLRSVAEVVYRDGPSSPR